jgi:hypothetical protein
MAAACKNDNPSENIRFNGLDEKSIEIIDTVKYEGFITGADFNRDEIYIQSISKLKGKYSVIIADIRSGKIKKEIQLNVGAFESPTEFYNPSHMQFLGGNYIIVDQYHKIFVYTEELKHLYTSMFYKLRYFIDFYSYENQNYFVIGAQLNYLRIEKNEIRIFRFPEKSRPVPESDLHVFNNPSLSIKNRQSRKLIHDGPFWPSGRGFHKNGSIYYANHDEKRYFRHDIKENKTVTVVLDYLKPKRFSQETAEKFLHFHSDGTLERISKRTGKRFVAALYPKPFYQFGIYDVGEGKIGVIGDLDTDNFEFRLDVLDTVSGKYLESIRLPFGDGLRINISDGARGVQPTYINVDKGYYLWNDAEGEDLIDYARITTFKIKPAGTGAN